MVDLNDYNYEDISKGMIFQFQKTLEVLDLDNFSKITGDFNPLHSIEEYAKEKGFNTRVVHGMLAGSLFSTLVGMVCPGKKNLYLSQTLNFRKPLYPNNRLIIKGEVIEKIDAFKLLTIKTEILSEEQVAIDGIAKVKFIE